MAAKQKAKTKVEEGAIGIVKAIKAMAPAMEPKAPTYNPGDWRDPASSFAPDDQSLEARMWRLGQNAPTTGR